MWIHWITDIPFSYIYSSWSPQLFVSAHSGTVCINLGDVGAMAYSHLGQPLLTPRAFGVVEDIFCIFEGILDNVAVLRQRYGLNKSTDEMAIIIEAYRTLKDRGPYRADEVVRDLLGKFAFVLYEGTSEALFTAAVVLTGFGLASTGEGKAMVSFLPQSLVSLTQVCIVTPPPLYRLSIAQQLLFSTVRNPAVASTYDFSLPWSRLVTLVTDGFAFASRQRKVPF